MNKVQWTFSQCHSVQQSVWQEKIRWCIKSIDITHNIYTFVIKNENVQRENIVSHQYDTKDVFRSTYQIQTNINREQSLRKNRCNDKHSWLQNVLKAYKDKVNIWSISISAKCSVCQEWQIEKKLIYWLNNFICWLDEDLNTLSWSWNENVEES